jgi:hypothetical protein
MLPLILEETVRVVKEQYKTPEPLWQLTDLTQDDYEAMRKEAMTTDPFDKVQFRKKLWTLFEGGGAELLCKQCDYGKVVILRPRGEELGISWSFWARILQGFNKPTVRIFWFVVPVPRLLPDLHEHVGPEHVNGGYTFPCHLNAVVIYRKEEATRVLIHEMLHATCTDDASLPVELKEAKTETFAELFLVAYASKGSLALASKLWLLQAQWIQDLNTKLVKDHGVVSLKDYSARYTVAREAELRRLGIELPNVSRRAMTSSRFTSPALDRFLS